jgi:hypothetical protein
MLQGRQVSSAKHQAIIGFNFKSKDQCLMNQGLHILTTLQSGSSTYKGVHLVMFHIGTHFQENGPTKSKSVKETRPHSLHIIVSNQ